MEAEPAVDVSFTLDDRATLLDLAREWCLIQIGRNCSNQVSNDYFQFAWANAHVFVDLKKQLNGKKITMKDLREKVVNQCAPGIFPYQRGRGKTIKYLCIIRSASHEKSIPLKTLNLYRK